MWTGAVNGVWDTSTANWTLPIAGSTTFMSQDLVIFDNTGTEPLVTLRYFGPGTNPQAPGIGDYKRGR